MPASTPQRTAQQLQRAVALLRDGRVVKARDLVEQVLEREPAQADALRLSGDIARSEGKLDKALERFIAAAKQDPSHTPTLDAIVTVGTVLERLDRATQALELAVIADPTAGARHRRLAQAYYGLSRYHEALGHLRLATTLTPDDAVAWQVLGATLHHLEEHEQAVEACDHALQIDPQDGVSLVNAASSLDALGRPDEARQRRERALLLSPGHPTIAFQTKDLSLATPDDPRFSALAIFADDEQGRAEDRVQAELTLAKLYDDIDLTQTAATYLLRGNDRYAALLARRGLTYRPNADRARVEVLRASLTAARQNGRSDATGGPMPVMLFGLPRAGKSLLEARLALTSDAVAVGERRFGFQAMSAVEERTGRQLPEAIDAIDDLAAAELREELLRGSLPEAALTAPAVISTAPGNHVAAAALAALDPRTVVVSCERDPRDLLLSVFLQYFPGGNTFAWTVDGLIAHLQSVLDAAAHWEELYPGRFIRVRYEDLVTRPAAPVAAILAAAGLPLPDDLDQLLAVDDADRVAMSPTAKPDPSAPVHRAHVGMWRRWQPHLPELFSAIDETGLLSSWED